MLVCVECRCGRRVALVLFVFVSARLVRGAQSDVKIRSARSSNASRDGVCVSVTVVSGADGTTARSVGFGSATRTGSMIARSSHLRSGAHGDPRAPRPASVGFPPGRWPTKSDGRARALGVWCSGTRKGRPAGGCHQTRIRPRFPTLAKFRPAVSDFLDRPSS